MAVSVDLNQPPAEGDEDDLPDLNEVPADGEDQHLVEVDVHGEGSQDNLPFDVIFFQPEEQEHMQIG